ncbi:hypothetical protein CBR_g22211 [Chara braunii]|uniref:Uncharacterized protein n=1 Tax=Chara braunii TaxID=69332 RepID=A0A388L2N7_CHABU|nr:hypothetical protein CBR_g22211 [Chara braunii]|eukprot:GBG76463.1 hypothetical protein CBR_g22211 [Chara braunii]
MRLAHPFSPCAKSVRHHDGETSTDGASKEDFEDDPWITVVPYMNRHIDECDDNDWKAMERACPWASHYKFANMLEFGSLIALSDGVLQPKILDDKRKTIRCRSRWSWSSRLDREYITSSPRTWGSSQKQELLDCARHCSFLEHYPPRCPRNSPQAISYCCVRLTHDGCPFATAVMSQPDVDGRSDLVRAGQVRVLSLWCEVEEKVTDIRDSIGNSLARRGRFVRMKYMSVFLGDATVHKPQSHVYGSSMNAMYGFGSRPRPRETPYVTRSGRVVKPLVQGRRRIPHADSS